MSCSRSIFSREMFTIVERRCRTMLQMVTRASRALYVSLSSTDPRKAESTSTWSSSRSIPVFLPRLRTTPPPI